MGESTVGAILDTVAPRVSFIHTGAGFVVSEMIPSFRVTCCPMQIWTAVKGRYRRKERKGRWRRKGIEGRRERGREREGKGRAKGGRENKMGGGGGGGGQYS